MTSAWSRAAAFGSLWAASEILLGNLLHSLRVPLAGTVLAAIGVAILVAALRLRGGSGVVLRAGFICALMKSVSPGAVIIGPMIGIMLEASIVEGVTWLTRRSVPGMLLAGALATAAPILQKITGLLVTYGADAANIYVGLYEFAADALGITGLAPFTLVLLFVAAAGGSGVASAAAGLRIAALTRQTQAEPLSLDHSESPFQSGTQGEGQPYAVPLLAVHVLALAAGLTLVTSAPLWLAAIPVGLYAGLSFLRYRRVARKFAKPRMWFEFGAVVALAAVALGILSPGRTLADGLYAGGQMVARATLVIVALSSLGVELRNPAVLGWFFRRGLGAVADALNVAAQALPCMMRMLGDEHRVLRHPIRALARSLAATVAWIDRTEQSASTPVFILSGAQGIGKTALLREVVRLLSRDGIQPCGFLSPVVYDGADRLGYDLNLLTDGTTIPLARRRTDNTDTQAGPFTFFEDAIQAGRAALENSAQSGCPLVIVDEIGPLEMQGGGWTPALLPLLIRRTRPLILVVRPSLVTTVCSRWNLDPVEIWDASVTTAWSVWTDLRLTFTDRSLYSHGANDYLESRLRQQ